MLTRIREVRRARGKTLDDVAQACKPPTTPQTIGRLETGTRTVSVGWLNRIADALGVEASQLVDHGEPADLAVVAILGASGATAPKRSGLVVPPARTRAKSQSRSPRASAIIAPATRSGATSFSPRTSPAPSTATC